MLAVAVVAVLLASCGSAPHRSPGTAAPPTLPVTTTSVASSAALDAAAQLSTVAQATGPNVAIYNSPGDGAPARTLANPEPSGAPLVFLVRQRQGDWMQVLLPVRPNGSTGWIESSQVRLSQHDFRIVVELGAHRITVYQAGVVVDTEPIGVGTQDTPTPGGLYYTKELLRPPDPNGPYGPYAYGLSGFSDAVPNFAGGEGVIGIHGTNDPSAVGHDVSHGCIRMSNAGITKLAQMLPLGVPVEIRA